MYVLMCFLPRIYAFFTFIGCLFPNFHPVCNTFPRGYFAMTVCHFRQCLQGGDLCSEFEEKFVVIRLDKSLVYV